MSDESSDFLKIDPLRLDKEWLKQPTLYHDYATQLADARRDLDEARTELDVTKAETAQTIRENPGRFDIDKPTVDAVAAAVLLQKEVRAADRAVIKAKHHVEVLQAAVVALDHRKRALTMLVELHQSDYFSDPKVTSSEPLREAADKDQKKQVRSIGRTKRRQDDEEDDES